VVVGSRVDERLTHRPPATPTEVLTTILDAVTSWFLPGRMAPGWRWAVGGIALAIALVAVIVGRRAGTAGAPAPRVSVPLTLAASYVLVLASLAAVFPLSQEMRRLLPPIHPWVVALVLAACVAGLPALAGAIGARRARALAALAAIAWLGYGAERVIRDSVVVRRVRDRGVHHPGVARLGDDRVGAPHAARPAALQQRAGRDLPAHRQAGAVHAVAGRAHDAPGRRRRLRRLVRAQRRWLRSCSRPRSSRRSCACGPSSGWTTAWCSCSRRGPDVFDLMGAFCQHSTIT
jgi:hypothetical protein